MTYETICDKTVYWACWERHRDDLHQARQKSIWDAEVRTGDPPHPSGLQAGRTQKSVCASIVCKGIHPLGSECSESPMLELVIVTVCSECEFL